MTYQQELKRLTESYLKSLNLPRWNLNEGQKAKIIEINGQSEWIIFNAESLISRGGSKESYDITSPQLKELLLKVIKFYYQTAEDPESLQANHFNFVGGDGDEVGRYIHTRAAFPSCRNNIWGAVKKNELIKGGYTETVGYEEIIILARANWKKGSIDDLLNDRIANSLETIGETAQNTNTNQRTIDRNKIPPKTAIREKTNSKALFFLSEIIEIISENKRLVQWGRELGINLEEIDPNESNKLNILTDLDVDWDHPNNNEARRIYTNILSIHGKNLVVLFSFQPSQQNQNNNDISQLRTNSIDFIKNLLKNSEVQLENNDWEAQINNCNDPDQINQIKNQILTIVNIHRKEKSNEFDLINLIKKGKICQNNDKLVEIIAKIENFRGEKIYELHSDEIQEIKTRLFNQESSAYCNNIYQIIIKEMKNKKITEDELSAEIKSELNKLKNQTISEKLVIDKAQRIILDEIDQIAANKKIDKLLKDYQQTTNPNEKKQIIQKIQSFVIESANNKFLKLAYQRQKTVINNILGKNVSNQTMNDLKKDKWLLITPTIITSLIIVLLLIATVIIGRKKHSRKKF